MDKQKIIYVICPPFFKTGGTELLHQLVYTLNLSGFNASIVYVPSNNKSPLNPAFKQYVNNYFLFDDVKNNDGIFIVPESRTWLLKELPPSKCIIWWESVDNYKTSPIVSYHEYGFLQCLRTIKHNVITTNASFSSLRKAKAHLFQSSYSLSYLQKHKITKNVFELRDYINDLYIQKGLTLDKNKKKDIVLFNPKKGHRITEKIIKNNPSIQFFPLINLTNNQVVDAMASAKVYIDFGNHPGMDRFPREACTMHCCVITNKMGSAGFYDDVPINGKFKFNDYHLNYKKLNSVINYCFTCYNEADSEFDNYRDFISKQELQFKENVIQIFHKI